MLRAMLSVGRDLRFWVAIFVSFWCLWVNASSVETLLDSSKPDSLREMLYCAFLAGAPTSVAILLIRHFFKEEWYRSLCDLRNLAVAHGHRPSRYERGYFTAVFIVVMLPFAERIALPTGVVHKVYGYEISAVIVFGLGLTMIAVARGR